MREGRYAIWGYVHMLLSMANGAPVSAAGKYFVDLVQGTLSPAPSFSVLDAVISSHLTPTCAMKVTHAIEGGAQKPYTDPAPCGCYFDSKASGATAKACTTCTAADGMTDNACGTGKCRHGFCEAN